MNDSSFESLKPPVSGELDESLKPPIQGEIDEAIEITAEIDTEETSLKPPVTG